MPRKKRARRRFDEDAAVERAFERLVSPTRDIPDYIPIGDRRGTEHISDGEAMHALFDMGYRQREVDAQRWRGEGPRKSSANREATNKVLAFTTWLERRKQQNPKLSKKAAARAFLTKWDTSWHAGTDDERDTKVESLLSLIRRRAARRQ